MPKISLINVKYFKILLLFLFTVSGLNARNAALLYNSDFTNHSSVNKELQKWEYLLLKWGINYSLVSLDDFDGGDVDEYSFAVGFNLQTASFSEFRELSEFVSNGGSLILDSSIFGSENSDLFSRREFWVENFSAEISKFENVNSSFILASNLPISQNSGGYKFPIRKNNISFLPTSVNIFTGGYFENSENQAGLIYGTIDSGKIVWFGFDVDFFSLSNETSRRLKTVVKHSFDWLERKPQIWISRWPGNYSSAVSFVCEISPNSLGAFEAVNFFKKTNIRPTFILQTEKKYDSELLKELVATGEIIFSFDNALTEETNNISVSFGGKIKEFKKVNRLKKFRAVKGARLNNGSFLDVVKSKNRLPFNYVIADERALNYSCKILNNGVVLFNFPELNINGNNADSDLAEDISNSFLISDNTHSLFGILFNSSLFLKQGELFYNFLYKLNDRDCWVATLDQISDWLITTENIFVSFSSLENDDVEIVIENKNSKTVYDTQIFLNEYFKNYQIKNEKINGKNYQTDKKLTKLIINKIKPKQKEFIKLHKVNMVVKN